MNNKEIVDKLHELEKRVDAFNALLEEIDEKLSKGKKANFLDNRETK